MGDSAKGYSRLLSGMEKKTVTKNHIFKPKISKEVKKQLQAVKDVSLLK